MKTNVKADIMASTPRNLSSFEKLQRTCCTALLGEDTFYENGESIKDRVSSYMNDITSKQANEALRIAKEDNKLRHMPLFLIKDMLKKGWIDADTISKVCTRPDDITEILAMYWQDPDNKHCLPKRLVKGLQESFNSFDQYQLSKYLAKDKAIKLKDALRIVRPDPNKSKNPNQSSVYKEIIDGTLKMSEDTWEVAISACGKDTAKKKEVWTRLLTEKTEKGLPKLGALALLRNLRNMDGCGVDHKIINEALKNASMKKILPFQIIGAARYANPDFAGVLQDKLLESIKGYDKLEGDTLFLLDVSGSMSGSLSAKSELNRLDACAGVAAILDGICENSTLYTFNTDINPLSKAYHGMVLIDSVNSRLGGGTRVIDCTNAAINEFKRTHDGKLPSRVIVVTDEADNTYYGGYGKPLPNLSKSCQGYIVNVASYEHGVNYNDSSWVRVSGWSEGIVKYISEYEKLGTR